MNEFYQDLMYPFIRKWILSHQGVQACCRNCILCIKGNEVKGTIQFYEDNIVELRIKNIVSEEDIFYLHFQMHDMHSALQQFDTFFQYLTKPMTQHEDIRVQESCIQKILLSCSGGLTTSYFAYSIQEILNQKDMNMQVDAVAYTDIDKVAAGYDMILLAPQIAYMLPEYKKKYGCKVMSIESIDFATSNFEGIIEKALN